MIKVAKFGGSSVADGKQFKKVKKIIESDDNRRVIVVSAPGRRFTDDNKITDLLYLCHAHLKYDVSYEEMFEAITQRYINIRDYCGLSTCLDREFGNIREHMSKGVAPGYIASRGEYLNAMLMADYLGFDFVDAANCIFFGYDGKIDFSATNEMLRRMYAEHPRMVIPGFYGMAPGGEIKTFERGGSDVTGAIAAAALDAEIYENWTDVTGILMVDPKIVDSPKTIKRLTYAELREMSYMGASVLHEDTVLPVRLKNIPVNIRNTNNPESDGTLIMEKFDDVSEDERLRFITGITGRKDFSIVNIYNDSKNSNTNILPNVLEICDSMHIPIEEIISGIDNFSLVIQTNNLQVIKYEWLSKISDLDGVSDVEITGNISLIAIVGRQMAYQTGIAGKIFATLGDNDINIRTIQQSSNEINITVGVPNDDFEKAIRVLYDSFT